MMKETSTGCENDMEIAILIVLFLVGTVGGAIQALRYVERRRNTNPGRPPNDSPDVD